LDNIHPGRNPPPTTIFLSIFDNCRYYIRAIFTGNEPPRRPEWRDRPFDRTSGGLKFAGIDLTKLMTVEIIK
jgi:hypothetical protein